MSIEQINKHIEELYQQWNSLQPLKPESNERLWKKLRLEWNYNSNHIEGNTLTYGQTELLLVYGQAEGNHSMRYYEEMKAHDIAIAKVRELAGDKERYLTEVDIRDLNLIILKEPFWKEAETPDGQLTRKLIVPGRYKTQTNHVRTQTGEIHEFALPEEVPPKMQELMKWLREQLVSDIKNETSDSSPIASLLAELHHSFIAIHPFDDGNGRIVRLLVNYVLLRFGYPPIVIQSKDRQNYISALQKADVGDMDALAICLGKNLISWLEIGIRAANGEDIREVGEIDKEVDLFIREEKTREFPYKIPMSREIILDLYEKFWSTLFETFERKFGQFDELFHSKQELTTIQEPISGYRIIDSNWREEIKDFIDGNMSLIACGEGRISAVILFGTYKGKCERPFSRGAELLIRMKEFECQTLIHGCSPDSRRSTNSVRFEDFLITWGTEIREKRYTQIWSEHEITEFVEEGKELFFSALKGELLK